MGRPLVARKKRAELIEEIRKMESFHGWEPNKVITLFAYLLPEGQKFTIDDVRVIVRELQLGEISAGDILKRLAFHDAKVLEWEWRGRRPWEAFKELFVSAVDRQRYYMPKKARAEYAKVIAEYGGGPEPEQHGISQRLASLTSRIVNDRQQVFLEETLKCLRIDANRAAIVMGWNLAYDHLRQWIYPHRMSEFNQELTLRFEKKNRNYKPIKLYNEFPDSEWLVLDVCEKAGLISGHVKDVLFAALKKRNQYAHPSGAVATPAIAAGYIEELLEHLVLSEEFRIELAPNQDD